jgi:hypothetical protein
MHEIIGLFSTREHEFFHFRLWATRPQDAPFVKHPGAEALTLMTPNLRYGPRV